MKKVIAFACLVFAGVASAANPIVLEAFGVTLEGDGRHLESVGFERVDEVQGRFVETAWYNYEHDFFDLVSAHAHTGTTKVRSIGASKYYRDVPPFVDLSACERDFDGLVESVHRRYPTLAQVDDSASTVDRRFHKQLKRVVFTATPRGWSKTRHVTVQCDSGSLTSKNPKPTLAITYSVGMDAIMAEYEQLLARERARAVQEIQSKGVKPNEL